MNGKELLLGINNIDDTFIEEAGTKVLKKHRTPMWKQSLTVAACPGLLLIAVYALYPDMFHKGTPMPVSPSSKAPIDAATPEGLPAPDEDKIVVNKMAEQYTDSAKWYDPKLYEQQKWNKKDVCDYYGKDLTPSYIPEGLHPAAYNGKMNAVVKKLPSTETAPEETQEQAQANERIIEDAVSYSFYHTYPEGNPPDWIYGGNIGEGFTLTASKVGIVRDCFYISPDDKVEQSTIKGIPVTIGYRSMPYGPYNSDTHEPSGYYDLYVAQFKYDGIEYEIVAEQLPLGEVVKIVRGVIL